MNKIHKFLFILVSLILWRCGDADLNNPIGGTAIPLQIEVTEVVNNYGESIVYYKRPNDLNLKYVSCEYEPREGVRRVVNASFYSDSLLLNGFASAGDYNVNIFSVSSSEVRSEPTRVKISPLAPPYVSVLNSITVEPAFGGVSINVKNPTLAKLAFVIIKMDNTNDWSEINRLYSEVEEVTFKIRNQESVESTFGIYIRDRWGQFSDTLVTTLVPKLELACEKKLFTAMKMPGDTYEAHKWGGASNNNSIDQLWNDEYPTYDPSFHTKPGTPMPQHFGIDLGEKYLLNRVEVWPRAEKNILNMVWQAGWPKRIQFWGSNDPVASQLEPNEDVEYWDSWELIGDYDIERPSGVEEPADIVAMTDDDKRVVDTGYEIEFPDNTKFRYIRCRTMDTWGNASWVMLSELCFFGIADNESGDN